MSPFVCIYASQVATCIGANKHKKISEAMELMWQRADVMGFRAALKRNRVKTDEEIAEDIIRSHDGVKELVDYTLTTPCDSSDQVARHYDLVAKGLKTVSLNDEDRRLVDDVLKRNLYTTYGNQQESVALRCIRDRLGIKCHEDPTFYKKEQGVCTGPWGSFTWYVGGKIDAIDDARSLLVEIKNRVNRLFYRVPFYEQVQVQTYLHLLDLEKGMLVECLKTGDADMAVNAVRITRDKDLWTQDIVPKLCGFVDFLARLLHDVEVQDRYLQSKRRSAMITSHVNNWIKFH